MVSGARLRSDRSTSITRSGRCADLEIVHRPRVALEAPEAGDRQECTVSYGLRIGAEVAGDVDDIHHLVVEGPIEGVGVVRQIETVTMAALQQCFDLLIGPIDAGGEGQAGGCDVDAAGFGCLYVSSSFLLGAEGAGVFASVCVLGILAEVRWQ